MSAMPIFADPSTTVVYQPVPPANSKQTSFLHGGQPPHPPPPTMEMVVVQNAPQPPPHLDSRSNMPLPPGMEIVLGDKKFTIQYQSYEMTKEKATEYIEKCTGTPYPRMSSPLDPQPIVRPPSVVVGGSRVQSRGAFGGTPLAMAGDRGTKPASKPSTTTPEEQQQRLKTPDEVYTTMAPAAITRGLLSQSQLPHQTYAPPPSTLGGTEHPQQQNLGYFLEDGVWKVWQANDTTNNSSGDIGDASAKMPPVPIPVQRSQNRPEPYALQNEPERPQYQYEYHYTQRQPPASEPFPYALTPTQEQQQHQLHHTEWKQYSRAYKHRSNAVSIHDMTNVP